MGGWIKKVGGKAIVNLVNEVSTYDVGIDDATYRVSKIYDDARGELYYEVKDADWDEIDPQEEIYDKIMKAFLENVEE